MTKSHFLLRLSRVLGQVNLDNPLSQDETLKSARSYAINNSLLEEDVTQQNPMLMSIVALYNTQKRLHSTEDLIIYNSHQEAAWEYYQEQQKGQA